MFCENLDSNQDSCFFNKRTRSLEASSVDKTSHFF